MVQDTIQLLPLLVVVQQGSAIAGFPDGLVVLSRSPKLSDRMEPLMNGFARQTMK